MGCMIVGTSTGYDFKSPQPNSTVLASSTSTSPPITFTFNNYQGWNWTVTVANLTPMSGSWSNNAPSSEEEIGTWSADSGADAESAAATSAT